MKIQKVDQSEIPVEDVKDNFISFNFLLVKGNFSDPMTHRWLLLLVFTQLGNISPENIPYLKSLIELIKHLI